MIGWMVGYLVGSLFLLIWFSSPWRVSVHKLHVSQAFSRACCAHHLWAHIRTHTRASATRAHELCLYAVLLCRTNPMIAGCGSSLAALGATEREIAAMFKVYGAEYTTKRGTRRKYIGSTKWLHLREGFLKSKPPAYMRCMDADGKLDVKVLEEGIESKAAALAVEALLAARGIAKDPRRTRGGPWSQPGPLGASALAEIRAVAACRSLVSLSGVAAERPKGPLARHLRDLKFVKAAGAPAEATVTRGAHVVRVRRKPSSGRTGTPGNQCRAEQLDRGVFARGSSAHRRLHRGRSPTACRRRETARRKGRN